MLFIYLQINSTDTIGTELNLFAGAESGNSDCTSNKYIIIIFCFPLIFVLYSIIFKNLFKSLFQKSNLSFSQHYLHFLSNLISTQIFSFCTESHHSPTSLSFFPFNKYLSFFHKISHQIPTHLSNSYFISILSSSPTKWRSSGKRVFLWSSQSWW